MKKYLALVLGVLFVLSFAASAFAIHAEIPSETQAVVAGGATQITLGGEIRVRGWYKGNLGTGEAWVVDTRDGDVEPWHGDVDIDKLGVKAPAYTYYDQRVRLFVDAKVTPNVEGFVMLETNNGVNDSESSLLSNNTDVYTWGSFNQKAPAMNILEAWILYSGSGLFGFPAGMKIGHMPLALGEKQFFDHTKFGDDAIVLFMDPVKPLHLAALTIKFNGDGGTALGNVPLLGLEGVGGGYPNSYSDDLDGYVGLMVYKLDDNNTVGVNYTYLHQEALKFSHQDLGFHANGNVAGLGYKGEVDFQFGSVGEHHAKQDFRGYAVMLGLNYNLNPVNLRGSFGYGTGDDKDGHDIDTFIPYLGADQHYTLIYEYQAATTALGTATGLANTTYYNLGLDYAATKDLSFGLDGYLLYATKTYSGISKNAGWEVDGKMVYKIAKNLTYQIDAGYFDPGNFYEDTLKVAGNHELDPDYHDRVKTTDIHGITLLRHMLTLSF